MPKILVLDRHRSANPLEKVYLRQTNARLIHTSQAKDALALAIREKPDLIIVANTLDGGAGLAVLADLHKSAPLRMTPIFFVGPPSTLQPAQEAGATETLLYPVDRTALLDTLRKHTKLMVRGHFRYPLSIRVEYTSGTRGGRGYTKDLSAGGLFLKIDPPFPLGTEAELKVYLPLRNGEVILEARAVVIRSVAKPEEGGFTLPGCGFRFITRQDEATRMISELLRMKGLAP